jgi:DNA polymerase-1
MAGNLDHVNLHLVQTLEDAEAFMRWLGERRTVLGVDTETSGLRPESHKIRLIQFGDLNTGWAIPWERWSGLAEQVFNEYEGDFVLHNSKFDVRFITNALGTSWDWSRTHDTMAMAHLLDPLRSKGLKPLAAMLVDAKAVAAQRSLQDGMDANKWTWDTVPIDFPPYWLYAAMDPVLTCHIYEKLAPDIHTEQHRDVYDLEMGTTRVIAKMEAKGARVNLEYCETKQRELMSYVQEAREWLRAEHGIQNATSNAQLISFFEQNNIQMLDKKTDSGAQSLDKEVLNSVDHIVAEVVLNIKKAEKNTGPYFKNFLHLADSNERVHPNIWTMGTRTARMSIDTPALQTLPRKDPTVRTAFVPSEGNVLITCDYDQIEARLTAHFSQDPGLIAAFASEEDFFCRIASDIFGEPISKNDPRRQLTKNTVYGKLYGAGVDKMAQTAKVNFDQMEAVVAGFDSKFPGVTSLQRKIVNLGSSRKKDSGRGYVVTPYGRMLFSDPGKEYTLVNYLIQSHAAEILKRKIVDLDAVLDEDWMILPVHDEVVFDVPQEHSTEALRIIEETMQDTTGYLVPITTSGDILDTDWGQKYR